MIRRALRRTTSAAVAVAAPPLGLGLLWTGALLACVLMVALDAIPTRNGADTPDAPARPDPGTTSPLPSDRPRVGDSGGPS